MKRIPTVGVVLIDGSKVLLVEHGESSGHLTGSFGTPGEELNGEKPLLRLQLGK